MRNMMVTSIENEQIVMNADNIEGMQDRKQFRTIWEKGGPSYKVKETIPELIRKIHTAPKGAANAV